LSPSLQLTPGDRLLVVAPHPDDESLASGGLIQRAVRLSAEVRVIFISDGDNNPWPQRLLERRWRIGSQGRQRWGARRRAEAIAALRVLGVPEKDIVFLGWPDQGTTGALLHAREDSIDVLSREIGSWRPTILAAPSSYDVHPDHNALAVQLEIALARTTCRPRQLRYFIHRRGKLPRHPVTLRLTEAEQAKKRDAILCHATQMALSRRRFLAYARSTEQFFPTDAPPADHPIREASIEGGALCISVKSGKFGAGRLLLAFESLVEGSMRWSVALQNRPGRARIHDAITGAPRRSGTIRTGRGRLEIRIPLAPVMPVARIFAKYDRRLAFYDFAGWREIPVQTPDPSSCSALPLSAISSSSPSFAPSSFGGASVASD
jgi:LmbE family N-acetylglucosaminyl deacetylase